jgi:SAM-dependent methyltransferase
MTFICKICDNRLDNVPYQVREMRLGLREVFTYFQCAACQCLQIQEIPTDISKYYPSHYYSFGSVGDSEKIGKISKYLRTIRLKHRLQRPSISGFLLEKIFGVPDLPGPFGTLRVDPEAKILDYGCGSGYLLSRLAAKGYKNLTGADPFIPSSARYLNGVVIHKATISELDGVYDFIMLNHSFEHLPNPREILKALKERLAADGRLLLRIPTVSSFAWKQYRENWVQLDAPRHFYLHSLDSIQRLTTEAGLTVESIKFDSDAFQFWGSEQYLLDIPLQDVKSFSENPSNSIFSNENITDYKTRTQKLNESCDGDQIALMLRKSN